MAAEPAPRISSSAMAENLMYDLNDMCILLIDGYSTDGLPPLRTGWKDSSAALNLQWLRQEIFAFAME